MNGRSPDAVVAGNPARVVRRRFDSNVVDALESIAWRNWPAEKVTANLRHIVAADVDAVRRRV